MKQKFYLIKNTKEKQISADKMATLISRYSIAGTTYNQHGQVIYLSSLNGKRIHSLLISSECEWS